MIKKSIVIGILVLFCSIALATQKTDVTFINNNTDTMLGIVKFVMEDNEPVDYDNLNIRWKDEKKVLYLEPGFYGVTQYQPKKEVVINGVLCFTPDKIVNYKTFYVKGKPVKVIF